MEKDFDYKGYGKHEIKVSPQQLQEARNSLLDLRESFGIQYDSLPAPDRLIRLVDRAIELIPGEGEPSEAPYN